MNRTLAVAVVLCGLAALAVLLNRGTAQPPNLAPLVNMRYQVIAAGMNHNDLVLLDTATGRAWRRDLGRQEWHDLKTPPSMEKR